MGGAGDAPARCGDGEAAKGGCRGARGGARREGARTIGVVVLYVRCLQAFLSCPDTWGEPLLRVGEKMAYIFPILRDEIHTQYIFQYLESQDPILTYLQRVAGARGEEARNRGPGSVTDLTWWKVNFAPPRHVAPLAPSPLTPSRHLACGSFRGTITPIFGPSPHGRRICICNLTNFRAARWRAQANFRSNFRKSLPGPTNGLQVAREWR